MNKKILMMLNKIDQHIKQAKRDIERLQLKGSCRSHNDNLYLKHLQEKELQRLLKEHRMYISGYYGRHVEECPYRMEYHNPHKQGNNLRIETNGIEKYRCGASLKEHVQEMADRLNLKVFEPIDFEPCCASGKCFKLV